MSIRWDTRNKCWRFEFDRVIAGHRKRTSKLLPKGWSQAQADAFDRKESARLYAIATGVERPQRLIDDAVLLYLQDKTELKSYQSAVENLAAIAWAHAGKTMDELAEVAQTIAAHRAGVRDGKVLSQGTIKGRLALLKAACRWAWKKHGFCESDPTARMILPEVRNERHVYATRQEVGKLVRAADRRDVRQMILAAFYTGMRLGELERVAVDGGRLVLADTKNGDRRVIPAHPQMARLGLLKALPLTTGRSTLEAGWKRARARAKLSHIRIHDLRHSAASEMVNAGVDLYTVGKVLGHRDPRSTQRYSHLRDETLQLAVGSIGRKSRTTAEPEKKKATG